MPKTATSAGGILNEKVEERIHGIFVPELGDLGESLALQRNQAGILNGADHDGVGAGNFLPFVVPIFGRSEHVFADALTGRGIFQALDQFCVAAIVRPWRNEGGEIVVPGGVGVGVGADIGSGGAGGVDLGDDFGHASPVIFAGDLDVPDFDGDVSLAADAKSFVDGFENRVALVAHVGGVDAAKLSGFGGERDQFFGLRVGGWRVFERGGDADCAIFHGLAHERLHLLELRGSGLLVVVAEHHAADLRGADIAREIDAHALLFEAREILAEGAPVGSDLEMLKAAAIGLNDRVVERSDGAAFAGDFGGDALINFRGQARVDEDGQFRLAEHVDETGRNDFAGRVDGALARGGGEIADGGDFSVADAEVSGIPGGTGAVDDVAIGDDEVEGRGLGKEGGRGE